MIYIFFLQGIKAVIAESYERIHRSNLVGMGIIPLQFRLGENAETLKLTGHEIYDIDIPENCKPLQEIQVNVSKQINIFDFLLKLFKYFCLFILYRPVQVLHSRLFCVSIQKQIFCTTNMEEF